MENSPSQRTGRFRPMSEVMREIVVSTRMRQQMFFQTIFITERAARRNAMGLDGESDGKSGAEPTPSDPP